MKLSQVKTKLENLDQIGFLLPNGNLVPSHYHVTEVGKVTKNFIDCGGTVRTEEAISFQLWNERDYDHRLHPEKLLKIIQLSEKVLQLEDLEVEVEYQGESIQKFGLDFNGEYFKLTTKQTDCLAKENCGIPEENSKKEDAEMNKVSCCAPNSDCC